MPAFRAFAAYPQSLRSLRYSTTLHYGASGRYRFLSPEGKKQVVLRREKTVTYDYENTYPRDRYADGCACSGCRSEGQVDTQPEETCTVTRYADSNA